MIGMTIKVRNSQPRSTPWLLFNNRLQKADCSISASDTAMPWRWARAVVCNSTVKTVLRIHNPRDCCRFSSISVACSISLDFCITNVDAAHSIFGIVSAWTRHARSELIDNRREDSSEMVSRNSCVVRYQSIIATRPSWDVVHVGRGNR